MYFNTPVKFPRPNDSSHLLWNRCFFLPAIEASFGNLLFLEAGGI